MFNQLQLQPFPKNHSKKTMEGVEAFLEGEWDSLSKLFSCEDSELLLHSNGSNNLFSCNLENPLNFSDYDPSNTCFYSVSQESSHSHSHSSSTEIESSHLFPFTNTFAHPPLELCSIDNRNSSSSGLVAPPVFPDDLMEEILQLKAQMLCSGSDHSHSEARPSGVGDDSREGMQLKRKCEDDHDSFQTPKKRRPRVSREVVQRSKRNAELKKAKKGDQISISTNNDEEMNNIVQSSSTCSSEEDGCSASQELNRAAQSAGKAKGSKSPATDPQSLYARKRRERINERLRILQNLVPNGTKVDISTMLEGAVHYVKFLQLQIKLLSSDDMWMYAPIAYNGMDIGLYQKIVPNV